MGNRDEGSGIDVENKRNRKDENLPHCTMLMENMFIKVESQKEMQKEA